MYLGNKIPLLSIYFKLPENVKHILFFSVLRSLFFAAAGIYIPIFIFDSLGIFYVILYFLLYYGAFQILCAIVVRELLKEKSAEFLQMVSIFFIFLQLLCLNFFKGPHLVISTAFFGSLALVFFWLPQHLTFGIFGRRRELTKEFVVVNIAMILILVFFPSISAILINVLNYSLFFLLISLIILIFAIYAAFYFKQSRKIKIKTPGKRIKKKFSKLFVLEGLFASFYIMIDIVIYMLVKDILIFGIVKSGVMLFSALTAYIISKRVDKRHDYALATIGIMVRSNIFIALFFSFNAATAIIGALLLGLVAPIADTPFSSFLYNMAKKYGAEVIYHHEIMLGFSRLMGFLIFLILSLNESMFLAAIICILLGITYYFTSIGEEIREFIAS